MSRFLIVNMVTGEGDERGGPDDLTNPVRSGQCRGCAWLFRAEAGVDDAEEALRAAVGEFFASPAGRRVLAREGADSLRWEDAIPWVDDEVWERHGLSMLRHPEVERVLLSAEEDLAEDVEGIAPATPGRR